jgi:nucleotidyltransferase AbiEii toxin of type IV toxin-antitoxin system
MGRAPGLAKGHRRALDRLSAVPSLRQFYLARGSAVAAHLGHRRSADLDLFSLSAEVDLGSVQGDIARHVRGVVVLDLSDASLRIKIGDIPVDLVRYPYPPLDRPTTIAGPFPVASLRDLAVMKLAAIVRRGLKRDFWDLHEIFRRGISLRRAMTAYRRRFDRSEADLYSVLRALTFFVDAERDPNVPLGLSQRHWSEIKTFFVREAPRLLRR